MLDVLPPETLLGEFRTGLWLPHYPHIRRGDWALRHIRMAAAPGYWRQHYTVAGTVLLLGPGRNGPVSWMSLTPSEIESQTIGLEGAHGHTVVAGMGMGWLAANAALKPEVDHVTVVERNEDVLALIAEAGIFAQLPQIARRKIEIVTADALEYRPSAPVDTLQADIWERLTEAGKCADIRRMQDHIGAASLYFWGQEMEIWRAALKRSLQTLDWDSVHDIVEQDIALPLILPAWPDYPEKIAAAAQWWFRPD